MKLLTVTASVQAPIEIVWNYWINPEHVMGWNFASPDWHCPKAENLLEVGGTFHYIMAAKDASFEFDFWGTFQKIEFAKHLEIVLGDSRLMNVYFESSQGNTIITEQFEPESQNSEEMQLAGWQMILNNFKQYVESQPSI